MLARRDHGSRITENFLSCFHEQTLTREVCLTRGWSQPGSSRLTMNLTQWDHLMILRSPDNSHLTPPSKGDDGVLQVSDVSRLLQ